jgi:CDP-diacylglycerol--serine O-phosphatidyltransferase
VFAIVAMLSIAFVMAQPQSMLFFLSVIYAVSGPVLTLVLRRRRRMQARKS